MGDEIPTVTDTSIHDFLAGYQRYLQRRCSRSRQEQEHEPEPGPEHEREPGPDRPEGPADFSDETGLEDALSLSLSLTPSSRSTIVIDDQSHPDDHHGHYTYHNHNHDHGHDHDQHYNNHQPDGCAAPCTDADSDAFAGALTPRSVHPSSPPPSTVFDDNDDGGAGGGGRASAAPSVLSSSAPDLLPDPDHRRDGDGPDGELWCEFFLLTSCPARFRLDHVRLWIAHHMDRHFPIGFLPPKTMCWFCDELTFDSKCGGGDTHLDPAAAAIAAAATDAMFRKRMNHIAEHVRRENLAEADMRPDFHILDHMYCIGLIGTQLYNLAISYSEMPPPRNMMLVPASDGRRAPSPELPVVITVGAERRERRRQEQRRLREGGD